MVSLERTPDLREELDESIVAPLFARVVPAAPADESLPKVVLANRRRRAHHRVLDALVARGSVNIPRDLERETEELVRKWAEASFSDDFKPAETFEIWCAREHDVVTAAESGDRGRLLEALEKDYRRRVIEQFGRIELRGLQTSHRVLQQLDEVYVPLHLEPIRTEAETREGEIVTLLAPQRLSVSDVFAEQRHVLIVGAPGSGKSTLVSYLATRAAAGRLTDLQWKVAPLPLVLTVRAMKRQSLTIRSLSEHTDCDRHVLERALQGSEALLLVDGLDEAPKETRERLVSSILRFVRRFPEVRVIATSRPAGAPGEIEQSLPVLNPYKLTELRRDEVDSFIEKWCLAAEASIRKGLAEARTVAMRDAEDLKQRLARSYAVQRIAVNPLLVNILCVVHRFLGRTIPEHRVTLYEKCTDALLYEWDRAKFEEGAAVGLLDAQSKRRLLMEVAREVHEKHLAEVPEKEIVQQFAQILPDLGRPPEDAKRIVEEIRDRSGLLVERRPGFFGFSHLTFQEYLCALDYVRTKDFDRLIGRLRETWWHEVIVLAAGVPGGGGGAITRRLLREKSQAAIFLAAQCLETESDMPLVIREGIEKSLQAWVPPRDYAEVRRLEELGIVAAPIMAKWLQESGGQEPRVLLAALLFFQFIDYEPAIPAIARHASNPDRDEGGGVVLSVDGSRMWSPSIGTWATWLLLHKIARSGAARFAAKEALAFRSEEEAERLLALFRRADEARTSVQLIEEALRSPRQETSPPKPAEKPA